MPGITLQDRGINLAISEDLDLNIRIVGERLIDGTLLAIYVVYSSEHYAQNELKVVWSGCARIPLGRLTQDREEGMSYPEIMLAEVWKDITKPEHQAHFRPFRFLREDQVDTNVRES
jgi:hypothetical protein